MSNNCKKLISGCLLSTSSMIAATVGLAPASAQQHVEASDDIVVIGERQAKSLNDTLSSVSVITEAEVERSGDHDVYSLIAGTPNLTPTPGEFLPTIRGDAATGAGGPSGGILFGTIPRSSLIVDDVQRISNYTNSSFTSIFDVAQVEVLRGPQTTLRGANAIAGAYIIKTKDPVFDIEGQVLGELTNNDFAKTNYRIAGMVNVPLIADQLALRVAVERNDGHANYTVVDASAGGTGLPPVPPGTNLRELTHFESNSIRAKLLLTPKGLPGFSALLTGEYQDGTDLGFDSFVNAAPFNGGGPVEQRRYGYGNQRIFNAKAFATTLNMAYEFAGATLRSITSYQNNKYKSSPLSSDVFFNFDGMKDTRFIQDFILTFGAKDSTISGLVGLSINESRQNNRISGFSFKDDGKVSAQAGFVDLTLRLSPKFSFIGGGRINHINATRIIDAFNGFAALNYRKDEVVFLPKFGAVFDASPTQTFALTARKGYNQGGAAIDFITFGPFTWGSETAWTYEAAWRGGFGNGAVNVSVTAFYNTAQDKQFLLSTSPTNFRIVNVPRGRSYGVEVDLRAKLDRTLDLNAGFGILNTKITRASTFDASVLGNSFGEDPDVTLSLGLNWRPFKGFDLDGRVIYVGGYYSDFLNRSTTLAGNYTTMDLSAGYRTGPVKARVFVTNLTDKYATFQRLGGSGDYALAPRTFGASLSFAF